jgi:hypothetical protein
VIDRKTERKIFGEVYFLGDLSRRLRHLRIPLRREKSPSIPLFQRGRLLLPFVKGGREGFKKAIFKAILK